jgi:uncharacterized protein YgiM (DUF1202 family)
MKKQLSLFLFISLLSLFMYSHSGRTDSNGGHWDRKAGTYHYHNGGKASSGSTSTTAKSVQSEDVKITTNDIGTYASVVQDANIRMGPGSEYRVIQVMKKGSLVKITSINDSWVQIEIPESNVSEAWISLSLLSK